MPGFKTAYLVHGDDHGRIGERRARLRELAESQSGAKATGLFEGAEATPDRIAAALDLRRSRWPAVHIADGRAVEGQGPDALRSALTAIAPETTVAFFARGHRTGPRPPSKPSRRSEASSARRTASPASEVGDQKRRRQWTNSILRPRVR
jgi:DNA polymerase-3 subunit delta